jgi:lipopolysaccharide biosynthesis regulator YciM
MPAFPPLTWVAIIAALVIGILAGHFGWGRRWASRKSSLDPDYLAGLEYLVTEQPDRALDVFLRLMEADADTVETHFSLGALYRRRGEVERAIRIHQNLLARETLAPEHREQALLALAQDYLRAGLLDRAEALFQRVSEVPRLRVSAWEALRSIYERQAEWQQALDAYRHLERIGAAPEPAVAAHYLCELSVQSQGRGDVAAARALLREARRAASPFPRAALLRASIAERDSDAALASRLMRGALAESPSLIQEVLPPLLRLEAPAHRDALLAGLAAEAESAGLEAVRRLVYAALTVGLADAPPLRSLIQGVFSRDAVLRAVWAAGWEETDAGPAARGIAALLAHAERYRCIECGFAARSFYWHCPACHSWDSFESYATVKLG